MTDQPGWPHAHRGFVASPGQGERLRVYEASAVMKVRSEQTQGLFESWEFTIPPGFAGPSVHIHRRTYETTWVLRGKVRVQQGARIEVATAGSYILFTPGEPHKLSNADPSEPAIWMSFRSPGLFWGYLVEVAALEKTYPVWPPPQELLWRIACKYDEFPPDEAA